MRKKKERLWATSLCLAVKYVGAQKFCVMLLRRHPDGVDIVAYKHNAIAGGAPKKLRVPPSAVYKYVDMSVQFICYLA